MSPGLQVAVVAGLVAWSGAVLLRKVAPRAAWQAQARLSFLLEKPGRPGWVQRVGQAVRPPVEATSATCGSGCSACRRCG